MSRAMRFLLSSAFLLFIACPAERPGEDPAADGGPGVDAGPPAAVDHAALAEEAVTALCEFYYGCFDESRMMQAFATMGGGSMGTPADCATEVTEESEAVTHLAGALESGRIRMDWSAWTACAASLECGEALSEGTRGLPCGDAMSGTIAEGDGCFFDLECAGAGVSHGCSAEGQQCGTCVPLAAEGAECDGSDDCLAGLSCSGEDDAPQRCVPVEAMLSAGAACNAEEGPLDGNCDLWGDLICLAEEGQDVGTCTEATFDAQAGEFCFLFAGVFCSEGLVCPMTFMPDEENPPTCRQPVAAGETCLEGEGFAFMMTPCVEGYYCNEETMVCDGQKANGASCEEDGECAEGTCGDDGTCEAKPRFGDDGRGDYQLCP